MNIRKVMGINFMIVPAAFIPLPWTLSDRKPEQTIRDIDKIVYIVIAPVMSSAHKNYEIQESRSGENEVHAFAIFIVFFWPSQWLNFLTLFKFMQHEELWEFKYLK